MRRTLLSIAIAASSLAPALASAGAATHSESLAAPRLLREAALPRLIASELAAPRRSLVSALPLVDLRLVREDPVMRARWNYSSMAALPMLDATASGPVVPFADLEEFQKVRFGRAVVLSFPLAITGQSLVKAEFRDAGAVALVPTGFGTGFLGTFSGDF
jgi:hypothetical protein